MCKEYHLLKDPYFINYRCRKCGQLLASKYITREAMPYKQLNSLGVTITNEYSHPGCTIEDTEKVFCDMVSTSTKQIVSDEFILKEELMKANNIYVAPEEDEVKQED